MKVTFIKLLLISIFYFIAMFFWAIFYGVIAGIVFKIHGCIKDWLYICTTYLRQWKRYPKRSYEKYINSLLFEIKNLSEYVYKEAILKKQKKTQPFPFFAILTVTIVNLTIIPFRLISSIIDGPMIVFTDAIDYWKLHILKIDPYQKRYSDWLSEAETIHEKKS